MSDDQDKTSTALAPQQEPVPIVSQIMALASQNVNPDMFDRLVAWQEREQAGQAEEAFNDAMNRAQAEIEPVARTAENKQIGSFYAKLEAVDGAIRPVYLRHGFNVAYNTVPPLALGNIRIECEVSRGRHSKKYYREAPADTLGPKGSAVKTVLHGGGSTETFLKRYAVCGAFNVVFRGTDDDGVRGGLKLISEAEADELRGWCKDIGRIEGHVLQSFFGDKVRSFDELEQGHGYMAVRSALEQRRAAMKRKESE